MTKACHGHIFAEFNSLVSVEGVEVEGRSNLFLQKDCIDCSLVLWQCFFRGRTFFVCAALVVSHISLPRSQDQQQPQPQPQA